MAEKKKTPFSVFQAARDIRGSQQQTAEQSGVQMKETPPPSKPTPEVSEPTMTPSKAVRAVTAVADYVGLDLKPGFQNTFGSIKGMGKKKKK